MNRSHALAALALAAAAAGCGGTEDPQPSPWFEEVTEASNLDFVHQSGADGRFLMPEIMSTGAALVDVDGDGDLDAYLVQGGAVDAASGDRPPNRLFLNRGDGTFEDATDSSGAGDRGYGMGIATGDYDGDGDMDLFVSNLGRDTLLQNDGAGRFIDVTEAAGVGGDGWSASAVFVDVDLDGDLDLFVTRYIEWSLSSELVCESPPRGRTYCSPKSYAAPARDAYYENRGDGTFEDASLRVGLDSAFGNGLGVVAADFDLDGQPEIFVANDGNANQLWDPRPSGPWAERALETGCAVDDHGTAKAGMGVAAADVDDDGDEDLLVVNLSGESDSLYRNDGGQFVDRTPAAGLSVVSRKRTRFGVSLVDFDLDGHLDLFHANGRVTHPEADPGPDPFAEENVVLRGTANGRFEELDPRGGLASPVLATSRAAAFGDVDGDGDIDVLVHNRDDAAHVLRNVAPRSADGWIAFDVRDANGAPALGASLEVTRPTGTRRYEVRTAGSYCAASSHVVRVGLGDAGTPQVVVRWPDGTERALADLGAGRVHRVER